MLRSIHRLGGKYLYVSCQECKQCCRKLLPDLVLGVIEQICMLCLGGGKTKEKLTLESSALSWGHETFKPGLHFLLEWMMLGVLVYQLNPLLSTIVQVLDVRWDTRPKDLSVINKLLWPHHWIASASEEILFATAKDFRSIVIYHFVWCDSLC